MGCFAPLFKSGRPARSRAARLERKTPFLFLQSFFVFGFAKQMADVSQTRKNVALRAKKKALKDF